MSVLLNLTGAVTLLILVITTFLFLNEGPHSPEGGDYSAGLFLIIAALFQTVLLAGCLWRGGFDWLPMPAPARWFAVLASQVVITCYCVPFLLIRHDWLLLPGVGIPFCVLLYSLFILNPSFQDGAPRWALVVPAGAFAVLSTAGVLVFGFMQMQSSIEQAAREQTHQQERQSELDIWNAKQDAEFSALPADATIDQLLPYMTPTNPKTHQAFLQRMAARPNLDAELSTLLTNKWAGEAETYVAHYHPHPGASLASSYSRHMLERINYWQPQFQLRAEDARLYEPNMSSTVEGAVRIHQAGGDVHAATQAWIEFLQPYPGTAGIRARLKQAL